MMYQSNNKGSNIGLHSSSVEPKSFDAKKYRIEGEQKDKEFYLGARQKLMEIYKDIALNPNKQVSGLKRAKTKFKIPRIKRNKDELSGLLVDVVAQEKDRYVRKNLSANEVYMPAIINGNYPTNLKFTDPFLAHNTILQNKLGMQYNDLNNMKLEQAILNRVVIREGKRARVLTGKNAFKITNKLSNKRIHSSDDQTISNANNLSQKDQLANLGNTATDHNNQEKRPSLQEQNESENSSIINAYDKGVSGLGLTNNNKIIDFGDINKKPTDK